MRRCPSRAGFTIFEALMVLVVVGIIVGAMMPSVRLQLSRARVNRAANVTAADLFLAQSQAARRHMPVVLTWDGTAKTTVISLPPPTSTVLLTRRYGADSEFRLATLSASVSAVQVYPNGQASSSVTVTVGFGTYSRQVRMTRAGLIRVL